MTRQDMKLRAKAQIKGTVGTFFLINLVTILISLAISLIPVVGGVAGIVVSATVSLAIHIIYLSLCANGVKPTVAALFDNTTDWWAATKLYLLQAVYIMLWSLLLVIPGIIKSFAYSQAFYILAENPGMGANEALHRSDAMMKGHKMEYFILELSFYGWVLLTALTLGIAGIWVGPYMNATLTNYYLSLKTTNGAMDYSRQV